MAPHSLFVLKVPLYTNQPGSILSVESSQNVESKTKNVESKTEKCGVQNRIFGQLILRKIIKTVATRCQIFLRLKCTKIQNSAEALPQTPLGSLQHSPDPLAGFKGPYF